MSSLQTRPSRLASQQAIEKTQVILSQDDVNLEEIVEVTEVDVEKNHKKKTKNEKLKLKSTNIIPIVTQNSKMYDLNYFKQFNKQLEYCDRELFRIHDPIKNKNDHGSKDHGLVYIEFNAGLFQAMKTNMMSLAKEQNIVLTTDPKIELYGNAEERMLLDLKVTIKDQDHFIKMKVYNTTCGMDFQALKHNTDKKFDHLDGLTVGEYFTQTIVVDIAKTISKKVDIEKLNNHIKKLAIEGRDAAKTVKKCSKFDCTKDTPKGATISCIYCESLTHKSCVNNPGLAVENYRCEVCLIGGVKTIKSVELQDTESILKLSTISTIETVENNSCILCGKAFETENNLQTHKSQQHSPQCNICYEIFATENALKIHTETMHEVRKRLRGDTSLIEGRCDCGDVNEQNIALKIEIQAKKEEIEGMKLELDVAKNDVIEQNKKVQCLEEKAKKESELITQLKDTIENKQKDLDIKVAESENLKHEIELLKSKLNNKEPEEESQRLRLIIQDREKTIKKVSEEHKKELAELERSKVNAEENLNSAIQQNTKIKEKESTMYEIMEGLRKLLDLKDKGDTDKTHKRDHESEVEVVNDGAIGGAIPKIGSYKCDQCRFIATNMNILNKHTRQEHISTLYPCVTCDFQAKSMYELKIHKTEHDNTNPTTQLQCGNCNFVARTEKDLSIHKITHVTQASFNCELCNFSAESQSSLYVHEKQIHNKSKYQCNLCTNYFTKPESLKEHKSKKHNIDVYPCNECGIKTKNLDALDVHIEQCHGQLKRNKDIDIRDLSGREPCDPFHPRHTSQCCDRRSKNRTNHISASDERRSRGQCRYWSQGRCHKENSCRFAHIQLCKYQDQCRYYETCVYLHFSEQKPFLDTGVRKSFVFREEEFPQLQRTNHFRKRNL